MTTLATPLFDQVVTEVDRRFNDLYAREWQDSDGSETDFLFKVSILVRSQDHTIDRLLYALQRVKDAAIAKEDPELMRKALLWVNHYLRQYGHKDTAG